MMEKFGYKNIMAVPRIEKVVVNTGFGRQVVGKTNDEQKKIAIAIADDLTQITGQRAVITLSKKAISGFKIRQGMPLGAKVTLRGRKMNDFLERVINIALPRSRDFQGLDSKSFDKKGDLTFAIKEHIIFPEILPEKVRMIFGFQITITTNIKKRQEGVELLRLMGFPIKP